MAPNITKLPISARVGIGVGVGLVAILAVSYVGGHFLAGDKLPVKTSVAGVPVGGLNPADAEQKLRTDLAERSGKELAITAGSHTLSVAPADAGLAVDYPASITQVGAVGSWNPATILTVLFGGSAHPAVLDVDESKLDAAVGSLAEKVDVAPVDAEVAYSGLTPTRTVGSDGVALNRAVTATVAKATFLNGLEVSAVVDPVGPVVTTAEAEAVVAGIASSAVSAPVDITVSDRGTIRLSPAAIAASLGFEPKDGALVPVFDAAKLDAEAAIPLKALGLKQPRDATITMSKGKPKIVASVDGLGVDPEVLGAALVPALSLRSDRTVTVAVSPRAASFTSADAKKLGVKEVVGKFTTYFPGTAYRYNNIGKAARLINGTFLKPGESFSMNKTLGKRTRAAGWMAGGAIDGGRIVERLGGGISQATTTAFNAIYFAGLEDIYHKPHSLYFNRYPVGREATLDWDSVDMKFRNDSPYGVVMQASITGRTGRTGSVTVKVWSTKRYKIKASTPIRSNYRSPGKTIYDDSPGCIPQSAMSGFDVRHHRLFYEGKKLLKKELFTWRYNSLTPVVCGKKPAD